jgi:hypothetical protein
MAVSGQQIVDYLMQFRGTPYAWGGNSLTDGIDCSGLIQQGMKHFGIDVSRTTYTQIGEGMAVGMKDLQVGDAVYFDTDKNTAGPDHVGIYIGGGKFLHAPKTGDVVKVSDMTDSYYSSRFMGGRRFDGVVGGGTGGDYSPSNDQSAQTPQQAQLAKSLSPEEMAAQYGWAYSFLKSEPSLSGLFDKMVSENWTQAKFNAELAQTDFWKNNADVTRQAIQLKATDPASWNAAINANKLVISQLASKMGAAVPDSMLPKMAEDMQMYGMTEDNLRPILSDYIDFSKNNLTGEAGMHEHIMRQYAGDMGVDLSQQSIKNYAQLMVKGMATQDDFQNYIKEQAISSFPAYQQQIMGGVKVKDIANPYIQSMSQNLEMNPSDITLRDPTIMQAMNGINQDGKPTGMTMGDFDTMLRGDPRWRTTQQAQNKAMNMGSAVLRAMGVLS